MAGATSVLIGLEMLRIARFPVVAGMRLFQTAYVPCWITHATSAVDHFMRQFLDEKDQGALITTHMQLLLGCALPVWLAFESQHMFLCVVGILSVAVGDAAAAVFGSRQAASLMCRYCVTHGLSGQRTVLRLA